MSASWLMIHVARELSTSSSLAFLLRTERCMWATFTCTVPKFGKKKRATRQLYLLELRVPLTWTEKKEMRHHASHLQAYPLDAIIYTASMNKWRNVSMKYKKAFNNTLPNWAGNLAKSFTSYKQPDFAGFLRVESGAAGCNVRQQNIGWKWASPSSRYIDFWIIGACLAPIDNLFQAEWLILSRRTKGRHFA